MSVQHICCVFVHGRLDQSHLTISVTHTEYCVRKLEGKKMILNNVLYVSIANAYFYRNTSFETDTDGYQDKIWESVINTLMG